MLISPVHWPSLCHSSLQSWLLQLTPTALSGKQNEFSALSAVGDIVLRAQQRPDLF